MFSVSLMMSSIHDNKIFKILARNESQYTEITQNKIMSKTNDDKDQNQESDESSQIDEVIESTFEKHFRNADSKNTSKVSFLYFDLFHKCKI